MKPNKSRRTKMFPVFLVPSLFQRPLFLRRFSESCFQVPSGQTNFPCQLKQQQVGLFLLLVLSANFEFVLQSTAAYTSKFVYLVICVCTSIHFAPSHPDHCSLLSRVAFPFSSKSLMLSRPVFRLSEVSSSRPDATKQRTTKTSLTCDHFCWRRKSRSCAKIERIRQRNQKSHSPGFFSIIKLSFHVPRCCTRQAW